MKPSVLFYFSFVLGLQVIYFDKFINNAEFIHFFVSDWMRKNQTKQVKSRMACSMENRTELKHRKLSNFLTQAFRSFGCLFHLQVINYNVSLYSNISRQAGSTIKN